MLYLRFKISLSQHRHKGNMRLVVGPLRSVITTYEESICPLSLEIKLAPRFPWDYLNISTTPFFSGVAAQSIKHAGQGGWELYTYSHELQTFVSILKDTNTMQSWCEVKLEGMANKQVSLNYRKNQWQPRDNSHSNTCNQDQCDIVSTSYKRQWKYLNENMINGFNLC